MTRSGRFIVLEGVEGAGKTTQIDLLTRWLAKLDLPYVTAREPGGTAVGEAIREIVQERRELSVPPETELLLYVAARAAFVRELVAPALEEGRVVVADRYVMSTTAYQGYGRGLDQDEIGALNAFATGGLAPDLWVFLDVPVEEGLARRREAGAADDRIEGEGVAFLERVRRGYLELVREDPRATRVDGAGSPREVQERLRRVLRERLPETFATGRV